MARAIPSRGWASSPWPSSCSAARSPARSSAGLSFWYVTCGGKRRSEQDSPPHFVKMGSGAPRGVAWPVRSTTSATEGAARRGSLHRRKVTPPSSTCPSGGAPTPPHRNAMGRRELNVSGQRIGLMLLEYHVMKRQIQSYALRLPASFKAEVERVARSEGTSINQFIATAVAEKLAVLNTAAFFAERRERADFEAFDRIMARQGGLPPEPDDIL